ncbi:MAG: hypothetical protein LBG47_04275, partial [Prevotellaceae bacterium]|nr:hypothetical protein [Prevotellaceae bacterium]
MIDVIHKWVKISAIVYFGAKNLIYSLVLIFGVRELTTLGYSLVLIFGVRELTTLGYSLVLIFGVREL